LKAPQYKLICASAGREWNAALRTLQQDAERRMETALVATKTA